MTNTVHNLTDTFLNLITNDTQPQPVSRKLARQGLLWLGIFGITVLLSSPWTSQGTLWTGPVIVGNVSETMVIWSNYWVALLLFGRLHRQPLLWIPGAVVFYVSAATAAWLFTNLAYQFISIETLFGSHETAISGLQPYYADNIRHYAKRDYWTVMSDFDTFSRLLNSNMSLTLFPLSAKVLLEGYRRQLRNVQLLRQNTQLELDYLKAQVNPHFLFNVLNSIYALTEDTNPPAADLTLRLSALMRYALYDTADPAVLLSGELDFIRNYIALEEVRTRHGQITTDLPHDVNITLQIAPFLLIPFVENAFKHGVHGTRGQSWVRLTIALNGPTLQMVIENSKAQPTTISITTKLGIGLLNVKKRLAMLYPDRHTLVIEDSPAIYRVDLRLVLVQQTTTETNAIEEKFYP